MPRDTLNPLTHPLTDEMIANIAKQHPVLFFHKDDKHPMYRWWIVVGAFGYSGWQVEDDHLIPAINELCEKGGYLVSSFKADPTKSMAGTLYVLHQPEQNPPAYPELPRRAIPQPKPALHKGGDCSACVLGGILGFKSVQEVYDRFRGGTPDTFSHWEMQAEIEGAWQDGLLLNYVVDTPNWGTVPNMAIWATPSWGQVIPWFNYIHMAIEAGYYGIASVVYEKTGPPAESNHMVMICGAREREEPVKGGARIIQEILVSCSAAHPEGKWIGVIDFLEKWGGFNVILAKPKRGDSHVPNQTTA